MTIDFEKKNDETERNCYWDFMEKENLKTQNTDGKIPRYWGLELVDGVPLRHNFHVIANVISVAA